MDFKSVYCRCWNSLKQESRNWSFPLNEMNR